MYTSSWTPLSTSSRRVEAEVFQAKFGDGYSQRAAAGLNNTPEIWDLDFIVSKAVAQDIESFFAAGGGTEAFYWIPLGEFSTKIWICQQWSRPTHHASNLWALRATFEQVFDLV